MRQTTNGNAHIIISNEIASWGAKHDTRSFHLGRLSPVTLTVTVIIMYSNCPISIANFLFPMIRREKRFFSLSSHFGSRNRVVTCYPLSFLVAVSIPGPDTISLAPFPAFSQAQWNEFCALQDNYSIPPSTYFIDASSTEALTRLKKTVHGKTVLTMGHPWPQSKIHLCLSARKTMHFYPAEACSPASLSK